MAAARCLHAAREGTLGCGPHVPRGLHQARGKSDPRLQSRRDAMTFTARRQASLPRRPHRPARQRVAGAKVRPPVLGISRAGGADVVPSARVRKNSLAQNKPTSTPIHRLSKSCGNRNKKTRVTTDAAMLHEVNIMGMRYWGTSRPGMMHRQSRGRVS